MTSISQQPLPPQASSNASQTITQTQAPAAGKTTSQAAGPAAATSRSYASATKKISSPPSTIANPSGPVGGVAPAQHGKPDNVSPVNGRNPIIPAIPTVDSSAIVNGANAGINSTSAMGDHSRQPSVTISAAGASGYMPNGAPVAKPVGGNRPQFGTFKPDGSPAMAHATPQISQATNSLAVNNVNPRITSPTSSPSPIPQPPASGGRPPSTFQGQGNPLHFGSINGDDANRQLRPSNMPQGMPTGPQASHLRRDSSHSQHGDFGNPGMGPAQGRGGYPQQGGRGRGGYGNPYNQQVPYSPGPNNYRQNSNQSRGGQNMNQQYSQQRSLGPYPNSPHQTARSPALGNAQPVHPQHGQIYGQMPIPNQMYPPYGGYPPNMAPQVNPQSSFPLRVDPRSPEPYSAQLSFQGTPRGELTPDFSPISGNFERFLTVHQNQGPIVPQGFVGVDQGYAAFYNQFYHQQGMSLPPGSPRQQHQQPQMNQSQQFNGHYGNPQQGQQMSRTSSAISTTERPGSTMGKPQAPSGTPAPPQTPASNRPTNSPAPKTQSFQKPRKGGGIVIKDPNSGAVMDFGKQVVSPALNKSPANAPSSAPTPPPRTTSQPDAQHHRSESKSVKTDEEKRIDMKAAIAKKMEEDNAEEKRKKEDAENKAAEEKKANEEAEAKALKDKEEADAKQLELAKAQMEHEEAEKKAKAEAEEAEKAAAKAKDDAEEKARIEREKEEEEDRYFAEMERIELEKEEAYNRKKKAEAEEKARKEAEAAKMDDDKMKQAEREAEEAEEARLKKLEESESGEAQKDKTNLFAALKKEAISTPASATSVTETPEESGAATPSSETASMPPPAKAGTAKPKPAALKLETSKPVEPGQRSAQLTSLLSARRLLNISDVQYPSGFVSPNPALNTKAPPGKFNYDRNFLMQFSRVFVEKPSDNWETSLKQIMGNTEPSTAHSANPSRNGAPATGGRQFSANVGKMGQFGGGGPIGGAPNGRTLPPNTTSADRFKASSTGAPVAGGRGGAQMPNPFAQFQNKAGGFPMAISKSMESGRAPSHTGMAAAHPNSPRGGPSQRGGSTRGSKGGKGNRDSDKDAAKMPLTAGKDLEAIKTTSTGWKPTILQGATGLAGPTPGGDGHMAPDMVQRKVKSNLNKMTPNNFPKISEQILLIAGQSKDESDGRTLRQVIQLTFEKATDEAHWAQMYAEFCKRMLESMSPEIKDEGILDKAGNVVVGGALFRKYLLNRCQTEFERGWKMDLPEKPEGESKEEVMLSDEYYVAAAAKRRGLGLVRFIGELYKLGMLTERIMHQCVHKLVDYEGMPDEAEVESLTSLLKTIGQNLDGNERGIAMMDAYFNRIQTMIDTEGLPSRLRFMLMDIVDLRKKGWRSKDGAIKGPTTLDQVRAQAVAAEQEKEMERMRDAASRRGGGGGGRPPIGRGDARNFSGGGQMPPPEYRNTVGMEDLRRLQSRTSSRQTSTAPQTFGPSSMFASNRGSNTRKPVFGNKPGEDSNASSRTGTPPTQKDKKDKEDKETSKNAFSALASLDSSEPADNASPAASPPTSKLQPVERQRSKSPLGKKDDGNEGSTS